MMDRYNIGLDNMEEDDYDEEYDEEDDTEDSYQHNEMWFLGLSEM